MFYNKVFSLNNQRLASLIAFAIAGNSGGAWARDHFNPDLLERGSASVQGADLTLFESGGQAPGTYRVDIILNGEQVDTREVEFRQVTGSDGEPQLEPCLSVALLQRYGVKTDDLHDSGPGDSCAALVAIPQASAEFVFSRQTLLLSIPQALIDARARGYVDPSQWDEGINALMLNYNLSGTSQYSLDSRSQDDHSLYANLRPGFNIGPWRLRNYSTWQHSSDGKGVWDTAYTQLQRSIVRLKAQLTLGDSTSPGDVFDSVPWRGAQLASDDEMLPDSQKGYAPVVRGIARTQAQVEVRQNGYIIWQNAVAPGAFEITDMYPTGGAGDLSVTVTESDGSQQHFVVPFASLPVLQREGRFKYALTGGQYRPYDGDIDKTPFMQATAIYGLPAGYTLYGGVQAATVYRSLALGIGKNMGSVGALSLDVTQGWSEPEDEAPRSGQSWRVRYSKNVVETGTHFTIAGYRYSTKGYLTMQEVFDSWGESALWQERRRSREELTLSQSLASGWGALSLSAVHESYWDDAKSMASYSLGYNNSWNSISYGLTWTLSQNGSSAHADHRVRYEKDRSFALTLSVPLARFLPDSWINYSASGSGSNGVSQSLGLSGMALRNNALSWNVRQGYAYDGQGYAGGVDATYKGAYGEISGGYSYDRDARRLSYGAQGSIVAHADGVTFSQPLGETNALVKAPGAAGVDIRTSSGTRTDFRGYAIVNNLSAYRKNDVTVDTATLPDDVDLPLTTQTMVPTRGAVVRADFRPVIGMRALITLLRGDGQPLPFGAIATLGEGGEKTSIVGDSGQLYLTGIAGGERVKVSWGAKATQSCTARLPAADSQAAGQIWQTTVNCI